MGLVCLLRLLGWLIEYLDGRDLKNFMNALFGSAGDLIQGDSGVRCGDDAAYLFTTNAS